MKADAHAKTPNRSLGMRLFSGFLMLLMIFSIAVTGFAKQDTEQTSSDRLPASLTTAEAVRAAALEQGFTLPETRTEKPKHIINILLLGTDQKENNTRDIGRADATLICSLNTETGEIKLISFERGIQVPIPGKAQDLLTHAYRWGGPDLSQSLISTMFNQELDGYAQVDFAGFTDVVDALGGIDIELSEKEANVINNRLHKQVVKEGLNHMDGKTAQHYCRLRELDDDWARQGRQRTALIACRKQVQELSLVELTKVVNTILPMIHTNLSKGTIATIMLHALKFLKGDMDSLQVPDKNKNAYTGIACDLEYETQKISNFIYGTEYELVSPY